MMRKLFILAILALVTTPAFAQSVDTVWVRRYNGPANGIDYAYAIAVDGSGNVCVTGYSYGGDLISDDYATIKYYPNGDTAWVRRYNGPGNGQDVAYAIAVDGVGNIYVTGKSVGNEADYDYATIKYRPNGDIAPGWPKRYDEPSGNFSDEAYAIAVDGSGNVYVTGYSISSTTAGDYATIKYDSLGNELWVRRYNGPQNWYDIAQSIVVDGSGYIYVTGGSFGGVGERDYATIKYYPNGDTVWVRRYNGTGNLYDIAYAIAVDGSGNVYVTGFSYGGAPHDDYATVSYTPNGDVRWVRRYNGPGNFIDDAFAIVLDGSYNVYVTGYSADQGGDFDYATVSYDQNGSERCVRRYDGTGGWYDHAKAITIDDSNSVYVTGGSIGNQTDWDYATIKYDSSCNERWVKRYNGPGNSTDSASAIAVDDSHYVYITGGSIGNGTNFDYVTIKYVQFLCGDANKDGVVDIGDVVYLINYLFINGPSPVPILHAGDANCDEVVDVSDVVYLINYLFINGPQPCC